MSNEKRMDGLLNISPEWFAKKAAQEGDLEIGCGRRLTHTVNLTPEEIAVLERLVNPVAADLRSRIADLELRLAEAERVIEPFAYEATSIEQNYSYQLADNYTGAYNSMPLGLYRAARAWKEEK